MRAFYQVLCIPVDIIPDCGNIANSRRYAVQADSTREARERIKSETMWKPFPGASVYGVALPNPYITHVLEDSPQCW